MTELLLPNGYPYSDPLPEWIEHCKDIIKDSGKAVVIFVDGDLGDGKTTLAAQMLRQFDPGLEATEEAYRLRYLLGGDQLINTFNKAHAAGCKALIFDESGTDLNVRNPMSSMTKKLLELFQIMRSFEMPIIMVLPSLSIIDKQIFKYGVHRFTIHVHGLRKGKYTRFRAYGRTATVYLNHNLIKYKDTRTAYLNSFSNFDGISKPLPAEHQVILDRLGMESKMGRIDRMKIPEGYTISQISGKLGVTDAIVARKAKKIGIELFKNPEDKRQKMMSKEDYERLRTLEFDGGETI